MADEQFEIGQEVVLKSGGPTMTISDTVRPSGGKPLRYHCQWFVGNKVETEVFPGPSLKVPKPNPGIAFGRPLA